MNKPKEFQYSRGKITVTPGRAAIVQFADESRIVVFDGDGETLIIAPFGFWHEKEEAARTWRRFAADINKERSKEIPSFKMEPAIYEALRAATMMCSKEVNERLGGV